MTDSLKNTSERKTEKPGGTPFKPSSKAVGKPMDLQGIAPRTEPEPAIEQGIDLAGKTKIVFAAGRGKTGKTTLLRWIAETSAARGSSTILADIDSSNA